MSLSTFSFSKEPAFLEELERTGVCYSFKPGDVIVQNEKYCRVIPLIISGTVKVMRVDPNGNELFLYYLSAGESCAVSFAAYLSNSLCSIKAVAEEDTDLIAVPTADSRRWFGQYPAWREFAMNTLSDRMNALLQAIDNVAFTSTDERLLTFLSVKSKALRSNIIHITHQEIANELSTSREVVSRLLKRMEQDRELKLFRNKIELNFAM
jgi:CRP/FNR family transcriptional regulator